MTTTAPSLATHPSDTTADPTRNHARAAGIFYLLTFLSSIPALILIGPVLSDAAYVTGAGQDTRVLWAACSTPSTPSPRSGPPWRSTRWSSGSTGRWPSAS